MAAGAAHSFPKQIIDGDGTFNVGELERFVEEVRLKECGVSYAVVSIMGPQSSGKSTLLNRLFHTSFQEMDSDEGRSQTTKGIWMAKGVGIEPCTLVMDLEGTDGMERGESDTAFERQSALFALAISNIVLINMWCHDIGREQAADKPLLRTVFQVMERLFTPRKTTLLFVIRDKTRSPFEKLESNLRKDVRKIWDSVSKSGPHQGTALSEFFDVQVVALPSFEANEERFDEEVANLRQRFSNSIAPGGLAWDRRGVVHASDFSINAQQIWQRIKENKDLDLPSQMVMVSTIKCEKIAEEKFRSFPQNEDWRRLEKAVRSGPVPDFRRELTSIVNACLSGFEEEAIHFDRDVRISKQRQLEEKLFNLVESAFQSVLGHLRSENLAKFKEAFDKALDGGEGFSVAARYWTQRYLTRFDELCADAAVERAKWDMSRVREDLRRDMDIHVASLRSDKLSKLAKAHEAKLSDALAGPVGDLFENADDETWSSIRNLLRHETECAVSGFSDMLSGFEIDDRDKEKMLAKLRDHAKGVVVTKAKEGSKRVSKLMKERFLKLFLYDSNSNLRTWKKDDNIEGISTDAYSASAKLLSALSKVQLDDRADDTESARSRILIMPARSQSLLEQLMEETEGMVKQAISIQEAKKGNRDWIQAVFERVNYIFGVVAQLILSVISVFNVDLNINF